MALLVEVIGARRLRRAAREWRSHAPEYLKSFGDCFSESNADGRLAVFVMVLMIGVVLGLAGSLLHFEALVVVAALGVTLAGLYAQRNLMAVLFDVLFYVGFSGLVAVAMVLETRHLRFGVNVFVLATVVMGLFFAILAA